MGSWAHKPFWVPHYLLLGDKLQPPWPSLCSKGQVQAIAHQGREGMQRPGRSHQETIVPFGGRSWCLLKASRWQYLWALLQNPNPQETEDVNQAFFIPERRLPDPWTPALKTRQACLYPDPYLQPYCSPPNYKTPLPDLSQGGTSLWGISLLWSSFAGKAIKLFFSPSPKTLSLHFYSTQVSRGRVLATKPVLTLATTSREWQKGKGHVGYSSCTIEDSSGVWALGLKMEFCTCSAATLLFVYSVVHNYRLTTPSASSPGLAETAWDRPGQVLALMILTCQWEEAGHAQDRGSEEHWFQRTMNYLKKTTQSYVSRSHCRQGTPNSLNRDRICWASC